jgi:hypothetical protein
MVPSSRSASSRRRNFSTPDSMSASWLSDKDTGRRC